jgi:hypothetical protein
MCAYELIGLVLFIAAIAAVYIPAVGILIRRLVIHRFLGKNAAAAQSGSVNFTLFEKLVLMVAATGLLAMAYGRFVEPYWVEITHVRITSDKLFNYQRAIRVVHISDLHCEPEDSVVERLPALIAAEHPDAIVFTGDSINSKQAVVPFRRCLSRLAELAPTYAVLGNHDARCWCDIDLFKGTHVTTLNGDCRKLTLAGQDVYLAGVAFDSEGLVDRALNAVPPGVFTMFLYHSPDLVFELAKRQVDLICAGHTHGGQVCLPLYGAIITQSKFGKQFESGLHRVDKTFMYVNRGIGMEGGMDPRVRFLARPEITVYQLEPHASLSLRRKDGKKT